MPDRRPSLLRRMTTAYSLILLTVLGAFGIVALTGPVPEEKYLALVGIALASLLAAVVGLRLVTGLVVRPLKRLTEHVERESLSSETLQSCSAWLPPSRS